MRLLLVGIAFLALMAVSLFLLPVEVWIGMLRSWLGEPGAASFLAFGLITTIATATVTPAGPFSVAAGLLFGAAGFPVVMVSAVGGATVSRCISRYFLRERVERLMAKHKRLLALDQAVAEQGWRIVCLVRMSPFIPFNVQNYVLGIARVRLLPYILSTAAGIMTNTALCVYAGSLGRTSLAASGPLALILPGVGLVGSILAIILVSRAARRSLLGAMPENMA